MITKFPNYKDTIISGYNVTYKVDYGRVQGKWTEKNITNEEHTSKILEIEYIFGDKKQEVSFKVLTYDV